MRRIIFHEILNSGKPRKMNIEYEYRSLGTNYNFKLKMKPLKCTHWEKINEMRIKRQ
jgi:hypothetical protein